MATRVKGGFDQHPRDLRRNENALNEVVHRTSYVGSCGWGGSRRLTGNLLDLHRSVLAGRE